MCALSSNVCGTQNTSTIPTTLKRAGNMKVKAGRGCNEEWRVFGGVGQVRLSLKEEQGGGGGEDHRVLLRSLGQRCLRGRGVVELDPSPKHRGMATLSPMSLAWSGQWGRTQLRAIKYENGKIGPDCEESKILCPRSFHYFSPAVIIT